ncbi:type I-E CRISPR-associated protein Cas7/Cse4/CasC [Zavarzinia compransoris]|uniref:Type I-E CRISPR-associated protein Cas7/Cse4/CasC n=1 Tax=Zavarzinia compransoris TaxID=1264899 RepID=A0A317DZ98_9PROT|nr:type I-E CRISPR-associated protein Cas7/Cse4/CasC [Zavarzinia compransoris]
MPRFLQIHTLTPYAGVLLNRDDIGEAKRLPLGGSMRGRVSSQCQKRHWRLAAGEWQLVPAAERAIRSRRTFEYHVARPLIDEGLDEARVAEAIAAVQAEVLGESKKAAAKKKGEETAPDLHTSQVIVLGPGETRYIVGLVRKLVADAGTNKDFKAALQALLKAEKPNFASMREGAGLDAALFGRMITGDVFARADAAIHVAHAFTVHAIESEPDYFTAVDDIVADSGEQGSGHINTSELTSGLYYSYVVVDVPLLVANLQGCAAADWASADRTLAGQVVERLIGTIATVSPGAKLGSTAPYAFADTVLVEAGKRQPRSLANGFYKAIGLSRNDLREEATARLLDQLGRLDAMYGKAEDRRIASQIPDLAETAPAGLNLPALAVWARGLVDGTVAFAPGA